MGKWLQLLLNVLSVREISFLIERVNGRRKGFFKLSYFPRKRPSRVPWEFGFLLQTRGALIALLQDGWERPVCSVQTKTKSFILWRVFLFYHIAFLLDRKLDDHGSENVLPFVAGGFLWSQESHWSAGPSSPAKGSQPAASPANAISDPEAMDRHQP